MGDETRFSLADLARAAGMTTRNVRAYQTRGLIPPPLRVGRRSEYTTEHLERLRVIHRARAQGATLTLIADYLARTDTIDLTRLPVSSHEWLPGPRVSVDLREGSADGLTVTPDRRSADLSPVLERAHVADDPSVLAIVDELETAGVVVREGRRIIAGPGLVNAVTALHTHGLAVDVCLTVALRAAEQAAQLADRIGPDLASRPAEAAGHVGDLAAGVLRGVLLRRLGEQRRP
jgi:DNA-binding transcriptional MerR regulator